MDWTDAGTEQRLYFYFAADTSRWWVTEIRTRDGAEPAEWVYYTPSDVGAPIGASWEGDLDLAGRGDRRPGRLTGERVRLTAFAPGSGVQFPSGCRMIGPDQGKGDDPQPVPGNPDVSPFGITVGMDAGEAGHRLSAAGICHSFRLSFWFGGGTGYSQIWCLPPAGTVEQWSHGSRGELILIVNAAADQTLPPHPPQLVGC
jgi:hypothetical protein